MTKIEEIKQIILNEELYIPNRKRDKVYRRFYLANLLRKEGLMLKEIGAILNKNHATIIHYIDSHRYWTRVKDKQYLNYTFDLMEAYPIRPSLKKAILKVNSLRQLENLKRKIDEFIY
jgi:hypothetical protein